MAAEVPKLYCFHPFFYWLRSSDDTFSLALEKVRTLVQCMRVRLSANWMTASNRRERVCIWFGQPLGALNQFINSIVWNKNVVNRAPVMV